MAQGVLAGAYDIGIACGVESMTRAPMSSNARGGDGPFSGEFLANTNNTLGIQFWVAQVLADKWGITREEMDAYALQSHQRAAANTENGFFAGEIVPVGELDRDEGIRYDASLEKISSLGPAWVSDDQPAPDITAANSSQMTDGAAAMIIASADFAEANNLPVRARFKHFAVAAEDPVLVLSAPVPVTYKLMERTGMKPDEWDAVECNEAFAAIALMWQKEFAYPMEQFNPRGGAIALGHPLGRIRRLADDAPVAPPRSDRRPLRLPNHVRRRRPSQRHSHRTAVGPTPVLRTLPAIHGRRRPT